MRLFHYQKREFETHNRVYWGGDEEEKSSAEQGVTQAGAGVTEASKMTGPESEQYQRSFEIGKLLEQIMKYQQGLGQAPTGYQTGEQQFQQGGPLAQSYYGQTLQGVQDPYAAYESQLQPSLRLASQQINQGAQQRGLLRSGIPIEQMGRAGVDLAIKEAQDRMNFRGQELARGGELAQYGQGLQQQGLANMANLYGQQQSAGLQAGQRQAGGAVQAAPYYAYPAQAQLGSSYGRQGQMGSAVGAGLGILGASMIPVTGGLSASLIPMALGGYAGSQIGRAF